MLFSDEGVTIDNSGRLFPVPFVEKGESTICLTLHDGQKIDKYELTKTIEKYRKQHPEVSEIMVRDAIGNEFPFSLRLIYDSLRGWLSYSHLIAIVLWKKPRDGEVTFMPDPKYKPNYMR